MGAVVTAEQWATYTHDRPWLCWAPNANGYHLFEGDDGHGQIPDDAVCRNEGCTRTLRDMMPPRLS